MPSPTFVGLGLGLEQLGHSPSPRISPAVTLDPAHFLLQKEGRRRNFVGGHQSALPSPPYPALLDAPVVDSAAIMDPYASDDTISSYSATTTPLSPPSPSLFYTAHSGPYSAKMPAYPQHQYQHQLYQQAYQPLPSLNQLIMETQVQPSPSLHKQPLHQTLPSFSQFVSQSSSPESPHSLRFPSNAPQPSSEPRRQSLPSFSHFVAQIESPESRRQLPSFADLMARTSASQWTGSHEHDYCRLQAQSNEPVRRELSRYDDQPKEIRKNSVDTMALLAVAAAEIERDAPASYVSKVGSNHNGLQPAAASFAPISSTSTLSSPSLSAKNLKKSAKRFSNVTTNSASNDNSSVWLWHRRSDDTWQHHHQPTPPKRDLDDASRRDTSIKQEDQELEPMRPRIELPLKKRKNSSSYPSLAFPSKAQAPQATTSVAPKTSRPLKRSNELTDDSKSVSDDDDGTYSPTAPKTKKKRTSKPKDPNHVSPSGFRHGGERRVQEPDEVVDIPADVGPVSMLKGSNLPKVSWKGTPLPVEGKPGADRLHPHEAYIASTLRLSPAQYLLCKKTLILASRQYQANHKVFRKTDAQKLCHVDVNKASKLWEVFTKIGWLAGSTDEDA